LAGDLRVPGSNLAPLANVVNLCQSASASSNVFTKFVSKIENLNHMGENNYYFTILINYFLREDVKI